MSRLERKQWGLAKAIVSGQGQLHGLQMDRPPPSLDKAGGYLKRHMSVRGDGKNSLIAVAVATGEKIYPTGVSMDDIQAATSSMDQVSAASKKWRSGDSLALPRQQRKDYPTCTEPTSEPPTELGAVFKNLSFKQLRELVYGTGG